MGEKYLTEDELLCVQVQELCYGVSMDEVAEILQNPAVSGMPWLPEYYLGVCNWNGEILPVARLERLVSGGESDEAASGAAADTVRNRVVIVICDGKYVCGLQTETPPFILRVTDKDRLEGEGFDAAVSDCRVKGLYQADGKTVALIDVKETLREMAVCE